MKTFKGFTDKLTCRDFQYEVGKDYQLDGTIEPCERGFHACENPLDVLGYYPPATDGKLTRYCEVAQDGEIKREGNKVCSSRISIVAEIGLPGLIRAGVKFILDRVRWEEAKESNTGNRSAATNTGYQSAATNTGNRSAATNTGNRSAATNTGYQSAATNTGNQSAATNTGDQSAATNTGNRSAATNTGDQSAATNTGDQSAATVEGKDSIAIVTGYDSKASGSLGCWLVLTERNSEGGIVDVKAMKVDGETIKPATFYKLRDGKIIEADET